MVEVRVRPVTSTAAFAAIFADRTRDALLLCYEGAHDAVHSDEVARLRSTVQACVDDASANAATSSPSSSSSSWCGACEDDATCSSPCHRESSTAAAAAACVDVHAWECGSSAFAAARQQLGKIRGWPLLLVVHDGNVADTLRARTLSRLLDDGDVARVCARLLARRQRRLLTTTTTTTTSSSSQPPLLLQKHADGVTASLDVARMLHVGQTQLQRGHVVYAVKIFDKAVALLDALHDDVLAHAPTQASRSSKNNDDNNSDDDEDATETYTRSLSSCLAWAAMARLIAQCTSATATSASADDDDKKNEKDKRDGQTTNDNDNDDNDDVDDEQQQRATCAQLARLQHDATLRRYVREPLSDACRACTLAQLLRRVQPPWRGSGVNALAARLRAAPEDAAARSHYVIAHFLAGDVARALTEAVKLRVAGVPFGNAALHALAHFLGRQHTLVQQLGLPHDEVDEAW